MNKKRTTVLSSIAACAVIISLAVMVQSPVSAAADTAYKVRNLSTSVVKSTSNCPNKNLIKSPYNQQNSVNFAQLNLEDLIKSYTASLSAKLTKKCTGSNSASSKPVSGKPSATKASTGPSKSASSKTTGGYSAFQKKVVELVNKERAKAGLKPLKLNAELSKVAALKSQDMAKNNYFSHNSPTYGSPFEMMQKYGISYRTAGENIAMGQTSPEQVMQGWMNSPGHRANILRASFTEIGVGVARNSSGRLYWTQQFIG